MNPRNFKIIVPTIFIVLLLSAHAVGDAQVCVDCDLDKNIKIINTKVVEDKILYNDVRKVHIILNLNGKHIQILLVLVIIVILIQLNILIL